MEDISPLCAILFRLELCNLISSQEKFTNLLSFFYFVDQMTHIAQNLDYVVLLLITNHLPLLSAANKVWSQTPEDFSVKLILTEVDGGLEQKYSQQVFEVDFQSGRGLLTVGGWRKLRAKCNESCLSEGTIASVPRDRPSNSL